jgi:L-lactate dehydrogenase (cytochrome)
MFHPDGELAVARAAGHAHIPYGISTLATTSLEAVAAATTSPLWFQLYVWGDRGETPEAAACARALGFRALLVSVDTNVHSKREREVHSGLNLPTPHLTVPTLASGAMHPRWACPSPTDAVAGAR